THLLTGAKGKPYGRVPGSGIVLDVLSPSAGQGETWVLTEFTVLQPDDDDVDLVVLAPRTAILPPNVNPSPVLYTRPVTVDGECKVLGYPAGRGIRLTAPDGGRWLPFTRA